MAVATGADHHLSKPERGGMCGTPGYMPPELANSEEGWYDPTLWDVFSMAMVSAAGGGAVVEAAYRSSSSSSSSSSPPSSSSSSSSSSPHLHHRTTITTIIIIIIIIMTIVVVSLQVLYHMWSGRHPLDEFDNAFLIIDEINKGTRPILPSSMPKPTRELVRVMWADDPTSRPRIQSVRDHLAGRYGIGQHLPDRITNEFHNPMVEMMEV
jgi:serine/threonine protein kinase